MNNLMLLEELFILVSNETPYEVMKFVQVAERSTRHPKIVSGTHSACSVELLILGWLNAVIMRGKYSEVEPRYNLSDHIIRAAAMEYIDIAGNYSVHPVSLAIGATPLPPILYSFFMFLSTLGLWFGDLMLENEKSPVCLFLFPFFSKRTFIFLNNVRFISLEC